jgi:predicted HD phosphohydrolase
MKSSPRIDTVDQLEELFHRHGQSHYEAQREEPVTALAHALQSAQLAEWAAAPDSLVAAALLHDVGHFIAPLPGADDIDDVHELRALGLLRTAFGDDVVEPVRLHVAAKRYLVAVDPRYGDNLSPASRHTLSLQGGAMSPDEVRWFEALPFSAQAVALAPLGRRGQAAGATHAAAGLLHRPAAVGAAARARGATAGDRRARRGVTRLGRAG